MHKYAVKICGIRYFLLLIFMVCLTSQQEKTRALSVHINQKKRGKYRGFPIILWLSFWPTV